MADEGQTNANLLCAFTTYDDCRILLRRLTGEGVDPAVGVLTLQALIDIDEKVRKRWDNQFEGRYYSQLHVIYNEESCKDILRNWRSDSPQMPRPRTYELFLRSLTIFEKLSVPLFIDSFGKKEPLSDFNETDRQDIDINARTPIFHVTHEQEALGIKMEKRFQPSKNKNIVPGTWFGLCSDDSHYGTYAFPTTLADLKVTGLRQGEIVSYKNEVNVILYATDDRDVNFSNLWQPTEDAAKNLGDQRNKNAYVHISIFVPERILEDAQLTQEHVRLSSHTMCVREKRSRGRYFCLEKTGN